MKTIVNKINSFNSLTNSKNIFYLTTIVLLLLTGSGSANYSASINFYGEKTDVYMGEEILAKLSIVNLVSNPKMSAQVIILPSSGMSVTSADFTQVSAGQYAANYDIDPGKSLPIAIALRANQVGEFDIKGRVVYYFGEDKQNTQDYMLDLPVTVRKPTVLTDVDTKKSQPKGLLGFEVLLMGVLMIVIVLVVSVVVIYMLKRR